MKPKMFPVGISELEFEKTIAIFDSSTLELF